MKLGVLASCYLSGNQVYLGRLGSVEPLTRVCVFSHDCLLQSEKLYAYTICDLLCSCLDQDLAII